MANADSPQRGKEAEGAEVELGEAREFVDHSLTTKQTNKNQPHAFASFRVFRGHSDPPIFASSASLPLCGEIPKGR
jgi:hypothetical protein